MAKVKGSCVKIHYIFTDEGMFSIFMQSKTSIYQTNGIKIIKSKELPPVGIKPDTTKLWDFLCYTLVLHLSA